MKLSKEKSKKFLEELNILIHKYDLDNGTSTHSAVLADYAMGNILSVASMLNLRDSLNKGMDEANRDDRLLHKQREYNAVNYPPPKGSGLVTAQS